MATGKEADVNLRLVQFKLGPDRRADAQAIADDLVPKVRAQAGCERCEFFGDDETGDYGLIVLWTSADAAEAAAAVIAPQLGAALQAAQATDASRRLFAVFEPN